MNGKGIVTSLDSILQWVTRFVVLNLVWFFYTARGFFVLGIFPATAAALNVMKRWLDGEHDIPTRQLFKQYYKEVFKDANKIGWTLSSIGAILFLNYKIIEGSDDGVWIGTIFGFYFITFFYLIIVAWTFPLFIQFENQWFKHLKSALIIGLVKIHYTIAIYSVMFSVVYLTLTYPGIIPFFSISLFICMWYWLSSQVLNKLQVKM
ncbi:YesL family protein [Planococcus donghaensis]|uniref:YesL family protein n=1 Tax=Planococcus donghaensis TaxID=414778 RepID=UPI003736D9C6